MKKNKKTIESFDKNFANEKALDLLVGGVSKLTSGGYEKGITYVWRDGKWVPNDCSDIDIYYGGPESEGLVAV